MEDATGYEEAPSGPAAILDAVKKFGIGKILLILIVLVAALWFFVLAPKPGSVRVSLSEIDSNDKIENVQIDLTAGDQKTVTKFTDGSGSVRFDNVPPGTDVELYISPPSTHRLGSDAETSFQLKSAESKTISVTLVQAADIQVSAKQDSLALGTECQTQMAVDVTNKGSQPFAVQLVGDGGLKGVVESEEKTIAAGGTQIIPVTLTAPAKKGTQSGALRVKFTDQSDKFTLEATDPEQLRVNPSAYNERVEPGAAIKEQFSLENTAKSGEARDLKVELTGDFASIGARATFSDELPLKPKERKILTLELNAPSSDGESVGVLIVSSACQRLQIPLELNVESPRR